MVETIYISGPKNTKIPVRKNDGFAIWAAKDKLYKKTQGERRSLYKHDGDEIIYSAAFKRLSDKSQIVVKPERYDHLRSRLTHTLEVDQIAKSIGTQLELNTQLINAIALGHDIGHTPFGHAGERQFQEIMRNDVLPLCSHKDLQEKAEIIFKETGECENQHKLFHHASNSVRIIQRKFKGVSGETIDGINKHSWSPWQAKHKFGVPITYEGQVVAIADQIAGINHDTEDILTCCEQSTYTKAKFYDELPDFMHKQEILEFEKVEQMLEGWFLRKSDDSNKDNGWGRKFRLRVIVNDVVDSSLKKLLNKKVKSSRSAAKVPIEISSDVSRFLKGYELFVRKQIIGRVSWFKQRDAQAAAAIWAVYNLYRYYSKTEKEINAIRPLSLKAEVQEAMEHFQEFMLGEEYKDDEHHLTFVSCANKSKKEVEHIIKTIDFVSGMTDRFLMKNYNIAFSLFMK